MWEYSGGGVSRSPKTRKGLIVDITLRFGVAVRA